MGHIERQVYASDPAALRTERQLLLVRRFPGVTVIPPRGSRRRPTAEEDCQPNRSYRPRLVIFIIKSQ